MWDRKLIKKEANKVFTHKDNYWRFVLIALIIALCGGGLSGSFTKIPSVAIGIFGGTDNSSRYRTGTHKHIEYELADDDRVVYDSDGINVTLVTENNPPADTVPNPEPMPPTDDPSGAPGIYDIGDVPEVIAPYIGYSDKEVEDAVKPAIFGITGAAIGIVVVMILIASLFAIAFAMAFKAFLINPIILGARSFFLKSYDRPSKLGDIADGFRYSYIKNVGTLFLRDLFTLLCSLLFIVPGIIKAYEYRMIPYIIAENPEMSYKEAFAKSKSMMMGNKWAAFVLDLSFLGWFILNAFTCGLLGIFYVNPYYQATDANLYRAIKMGGSTGYGVNNMANVEPAPQADAQTTTDFREEVEEAKNIADEVLGNNADEVKADADNAEAGTVAEADKSDTDNQ